MFVHFRYFKIIYEADWLWICGWCEAAHVPSIGQLPLGCVLRRLIASDVLKKTKEDSQQSSPTRWYWTDMSLLHYGKHIHKAFVSCIMSSTCWNVKPIQEKIDSARDTKLFCTVEIIKWKIMEFLMQKNAEINRIKMGTDIIKTLYKIL